MVKRIHVTQDDYGYWMSIRQTGLGLVVESWGAEHVDSLLTDVWAEPDTEVYYSESGALRSRRPGDEAYAMPEARRARRPYTRHRTVDEQPEARV